MTKIEKYNLWDKTPGLCEEIPYVTVYIPEEKHSDGAIVIFPGGGYGGKSQWEGEGYARFFSEKGITAFVCDYRVKPHRFPLPLLDARRTVRFVRFYAEKYGLDKQKIYVMGSSAGGHLAALVSTYREKLEFEGIDEIDKEEYLPNGQILCYPVIGLLGKEKGHIGSGKNLLGDNLADMGDELSPNLIAGEGTPKAFIWHTFDDNVVNVINSLEYSKRLKRINTDTELHIFPFGSHGLGLSENNVYVSEWKNLLFRWLELNDFLSK